MIKVYSTPEEIGPAPQIGNFISNGFNNTAYDAAEKIWLDRLTAYCLAKGKGKLRGKIAKFSVGDGEAQYMVFDNTTVFHLDLIDGYQYRRISGMTTAQLSVQIDMSEDLYLEVA